jgi:hypothetical protein
MVIQFGRSELFFSVSLLLTGVRVCNNIVYCKIVLVIHFLRNLSGTSIGIYILTLLVRCVAVKSYPYDLSRLTHISTL